MTPNQVKLLEQALIQACDAHIAAGGQVITGIFQGHSSEDMCPLACMGMTGFGRLDVLTEKLGFEVSGPEAQDFVWNFDDIIWDMFSFFSRHRWNRVARMARRLRKKYITNKRST
jgi:hypothetical protein